MIQQAIIYIESIIQAYGAWGVFVATMIEEMVAPIPSALVPVAAGFFLVPPEAALPEAIMLSILLVALPVAFGVTCGAAILYGIAYAGGKPFIDKFGRWFGLSWGVIERMQERFSGSRGDEAILFALRFLPIIPGFGLSGFCGAVRYPIIPFILITFLGIFLRSILLSLIGWQAGELYQQYFELIDQVEGYILLGVLAIIAAFIIRYFWKRHA